jgi:asparagine synthase (glutamine-hydrolysing)
VTALAGIWWRSGGDASKRCRELLHRQRELSPHGSASIAWGQVTFGRGLFKTLPEDDWDRQPIYLKDAELLIVADIRIDNRDYFERRLMINERDPISDAELFSLAYASSGEAVFSEIIGDFAVAIWHLREGQLSLARDPGGQRPLHYRVDPEGLSFSSMPRPLASGGRGGEGIDIDERQVAKFVADVPTSGSGTYYAGVRRVEPGQICRFFAYGTAEKFSTCWTPPSDILCLQNDQEYQEAFVELLDRATASRLRRRSTPVGSHLSAGLDSTAVSTSAATILGGSGHRLIALTSAPRLGCEWPAPRGRISDESGYAAETAAMYPNMEHVIVRPSGDLLDILVRDATLFQAPIGHPCNHSWWSALNDAARDRGASVILTGETGNLTISAGGVSVLADMLSQGHLLTWAREASRLSRSADLSWRGLLALSLRPLIPHAWWSKALSRSKAAASGREGLEFIQDAWLARLGAEGSATRGNFPYQSDRDRRLAVLRDHDPAIFKKVTLGRWGVDERDVTVDRRLLDFCLRLPSSQLLRDGMRRRLARTALRQRVPQRVLQAPRGYQCADWFSTIKGRKIASITSELEADPRAAELLRIDRLREASAHWPPDDPSSDSAIARYRLGLLRALAAGHFLIGERQGAH